MNITIDGNPLKEARVAGGNLEDIIQDINARHVPMDRTIVEVRVNGETYRETEAHQAALLGRDAIHSLDILTQSPREIALHFMGNATTIVANIAGILPQINELLRMGDRAGGNELFVDFLDSFQLLVNILPQVDAVFPGFLFHSTPNHPPVASQLEALNSILDSVMDDQESQDWHALADHLEFDLMPALERLGQTLGGLEGWVKDQAGA